MYDWRATGLISKFDQIGTFWPFLATFGIEIITRWLGLFFQVLISLKTTTASRTCCCTTHPTLAFQGAYEGKTQKSEFSHEAAVKTFQFLQILISFGIDLITVMVPT